MLRARNQLDQHGPIAGVELEDLIVEALRKTLVVEHLGQEKTHRAGIVAHEKQVELDQLRDLRALVHRGRFLGKVDEVRLEEPVQDRDEQLFLGLEMPENQRLADSRLARDLRHRGFMKPAICKQMHRGFQNLVPRILRLCSWLVGAGYFNLRCAHNTYSKPLLVSPL